MQTALLDERTLSELDHHRLSRLIGRDSRVPVAALAPLDAVLDAADVLPSSELAPDIVTMNSCVLLLDAGSAELRGVTLCYPADSDPPRGFVSVLSPVGMSLLGLRAGSVATWRTPDGDEGSVELLRVLFQPEAQRIHTL